jgi:hypothetical protein
MQLRLSNRGAKCEATYAGQRCANLHDSNFVFQHTSLVFIHFFDRNMLNVFSAKKNVQVRVYRCNADMTYVRTVYTICEGKM